MNKKELEKVTGALKEKYPEAGIKKIDINENGSASFYIEPNKRMLAYLDGKNGISPIINYRDSGSVITRDTLSRTYLDLVKKDPYTEDPHSSYKRAIEYYYTDALLGTSINLLAGLSCEGFALDIDDEDIKNFFEVWNFDTNFEEVLDWIFLDLFKTSHVTTYKILSKYEPNISYISPKAGKSPKKVSKEKGSSIISGINKTINDQLSDLHCELVELSNKGVTKKELLKIEEAAKKKIWSKGYIPIAYTVLNPLLVNVDGNLLFDKTSLTLTPPQELIQMLNKPTSDLTEEERNLIRDLPRDLKEAVKSNKPYPLDYRMVGTITYRKQPYERYAKPRSLRLFDIIEYKKALRQADLSTLDGITNYILKITIGNDTYPVNDPTQLETLTKLFNTPSKSFDIVWNHTLEIEKIVAPEIGAILGKAKYEQVNDDFTAGLGISRALIDGTSDVNEAEAKLLVKSVQQEINYARKQVTRWIYREYRQIAEVVGFDRIPRVRWNEGILNDPILFMNTLSQLVDRRMLSYRTSLEALGFDYENELGNMKSELKLVKDGVFGLRGSPWQQNKNVQPIQGAPKGTPSSGRPPGGTNIKQEDVDPNSVTKKEAKPKNPAKANLDLVNIVSSMNDEEYEQLIDVLSKIRLGDIE